MLRADQVVLMCLGFVWFGGFYSISSLVGYITPNPVYSNISIHDLFGLVWLGFMAYQQL